MKTAQYLGLISMFATTISVSALADDGLDARGNTDNQTSADASAVPSEHAHGLNTFGIQVGAGFANTNTDKPVFFSNSNDTRTAPTFGVYYERELLPFLALRPELNYVQHGMTQSSVSKGVTTDLDLHADYLELPLMVKGQLQTGTAFTPYAMTGPYGGILVAKGASATLSNGANSQTFTNNLANTFRKLEFGWDFAVGSKISLSQMMSLDIGVRYSLGIEGALLSSAAQGNQAKYNDLQALAGLGFSI